eukprot:356166-Chlamydomonas_euryale.AAC.1
MTASGHTGPRFDRVRGRGRRSGRGREYAAARGSAKLLRSVCARAADLCELVSQFVCEQVCSLRT